MLQNKVCRFCKEQIDVNKDEFMQVQRGQYYHVACYSQKENLCNVTIWDLTEQQSENAIYFLFANVLHVPYNYFKCEAQRKKFLKEGMTNKGIYLSLKYFYEVQKHICNSDYGIGIVPSIYKEAQQYWQDFYHKVHQARMMIQTEKQKRDEREMVFIVRKPKAKKLINLDDI